jgi:ferritin-like metal-binding protein YciE
MATVETPTELLLHELGATLTMEETILEMLENLQDEASDTKLKQQLQQHHTETQQQIQNLRRIFEALGEQPEKKPCPAIEGLERDGEQLIKEVDDALVYSVILGGVIKTEHYEVAVYDGLIIKAEQLEDDDIVALLQENLEQEEATLDKAVKAAEQSAQTLLAQYS